MIQLDIPGHKKIKAQHLVLDYNGTLAIDGELISGVAELLVKISEIIQIHVVTADTFGKAVKNLEDIRCIITILSNTDQRKQKSRYISRLGRKKVIAIGNGLNDMFMLKKAALSIAVIQKEGASAKTLSKADIVCYSIIDALELLINPLRITATLRN
ncbi:MAG: HAD hydrolase family protein [Bacteroidales bacterium]|nr:HAD hydrolase family protein [Bacteroidales bacterium]